MSRDTFWVCDDEALGAYHFGPSHPFGPQRLPAYQRALAAAGLDGGFERFAAEVADDAVLQRFHTAEYVNRVHAMAGSGAPLDQGDTPAVADIDQAAARVVGTTVRAAEAIMAGECRRAFVPIAGLHHARRDRAAGFCVFNDCGVVIETLRQRHGLRRIAYVDIDVHHGDGVFYSFEDDPDLLFADIHQDGRSLFPGTGRADETGTGAATGTKLNIPLAPGSGDKEFDAAWARVEAYLAAGRPEFILLQCGADGLDGDPLAQLHYSDHPHSHAATRLRALADHHCAGRMLAVGGGGYAAENIGTAWVAVTAAMAGP